MLCMINIFQSQLSSCKRYVMCLFTEYNDMKTELTEYLREFVAQGKVRKFVVRFELNTLTNTL